jgi:hypothetical protein
MALIEPRQHGRMLRRGSSTALTTGPAAGRCRPRPARRRVLTLAMTEHPECHAGLRQVTGDRRGRSPPLRRPRYDAARCCWDARLLLIRRSYQQEQAGRHASGGVRVAVGVMVRMLAARRRGQGWAGRVQAAGGQMWLGRGRTARRAVPASGCAGLRLGPRRGRAWRQRTGARRRRGRRQPGWRQPGWRAAMRPGARRPLRRARRAG